MTSPRIPGLSGCLCRGCGQVFTSVSGFDRHQTLDGPPDADGEATLRCHNPESRGLEQRDDGVWRFPGRDEDAAVRLRDAKMRAEHAPPRAMASGEPARANPEAF